MGDTGQDSGATAGGGRDPYAGYANPPPRTGPPPADGGDRAPRSPSPPPPPADERAESGAEGSPASKKSGVSDFIDRLFGRPGVRSTTGEDGDDPRAEPASRPGATGTEPSPAPPPGGHPGQQQQQPPPRPRLTERAGAIAQQLAGLSGEELAALAQEDGPFSRAIQSEIDRRAARANRERDEQGRFVRQQRIEGLKQEARQARQTDVYKAAELEEQVDALQQQEAFVRGLVEHYDRVSIDPIMQALPQADRAPLLADLPDGLEGRAQLVRAALRRLEQIWRADEARKLRGGAQRKRENAVRRVTTAEDDGEPELVAGIGRGRNGKPSMNDWLRSQFSR
jgi:hypothetical protein